MDLQKNHFSLYYFNEKILHYKTYLGGGFRIGGHMYTRVMYGKNHHSKVISLQLKQVNLKFF